MVAPVTVSARERKVLVVLAGGYAPQEWRAFNFRGIEKGCDVEPWLIRRVSRSLARKGLAQYERTLWDDCEGTPAGAGYRCTQAGFDWLAAHPAGASASFPSQSGELRCNS